MSVRAGLQTLRARDPSARRNSRRPDPRAHQREAAGVLPECFALQTTVISGDSRSGTQRTTDGKVDTMKIRTTALVAACLLALGIAGCTDNQGINTATGAVVGGALGNQVGKGQGKTAATIGGAAAGAVIGARQ